MKDRYEALNGLRAFATIGIVLMHICANTDYQISGFTYHRIIPSLTNFTLLFMSVSAFSMCCGYHQKILESLISLTDFYKKRYQRIFPFFALMTAADIFIAPSVSSLWEALLNVTLTLGLIPEAECHVIGVGWYLGLVFLFYLLFPFFCFLTENRKRAWMTFAISLLLNAACRYYYHVGKVNMLYSACYFLVGGIVFLYRDALGGGLQENFAQCFGVASGRSSLRLLQFEGRHDAMDNRKFAD